MSLFNKMNEPVFLKESSTTEIQLQKLKELKGKLNENGQKIIDKDIKCLEYGILGENNIAFELKHSHIPMYILHDIYIENNDLSAQIDYIVVTRQLCFILECKNLYGNIEIDGDGNFNRTLYWDNKKVKEGIYSPITQNKRHLDLIKNLKTQSNNKLMSIIKANTFDSFYKTAVVLANPKTVLYKKNSPENIASQVIRSDQLINYIKTENKKSRLPLSNDKDLLSWAESLLKLHKDCNKDYTEKYKNYFVNNIETITPDEKNDINDNNNSTEQNTTVQESTIYKELKQFRTEKSKEENIKPYFIYNNKQLLELIERKPVTLDALMQISGFGEIKVQKYGKSIIEILDKYR